eukprot:5530-Rhodomonas_salina.1
MVYGAWSRDVASGTTRGGVPVGNRASSSSSTHGLLRSSTSRWYKHTHTLAPDGTNLPSRQYKHTHKSVPGRGPRAGTTVTDAVRHSCPQAGMAQRYAC